MTSIKPNNIKKENTLLVFALEAEAAGEFKGYQTLFTGVGKLNAAYRLMKRITENRPERIINLGSAGSSKIARGKIVCCRKFIQRDMDLTGLGFQPYETPYSDIPSMLQNGDLLEGYEEVICGSGDNFETDHQSKAYQVVDMEAYSLAYIASLEKIPFLCLKYISDGADGTAAEDWNLMVHKSAKALRKVLP